MRWRHVTKEHQGLQNGLGALCVQAVSCREFSVRDLPKFVIRSWSPRSWFGHRTRPSDGWPRSADAVLESAHSCQVSEICDNHSQSPTDPPTRKRHMPTPTRVVRRPQNTLVVFDGPPATAYKLSQNDVLRLEQNAGMPLDYLTQGRLSAAMNSLGVATLPLDPQDWSEMAAASTQPVPAQPNAAPTVVPPPQPTGKQPPVVPPGPVTPLEFADDGETSSPKLRIGLSIAVLALAGSCC